MVFRTTTKHLTGAMATILRRFSKVKAKGLKIGVQSAKGCFKQINGTKNVK
jgi:hypothetical protein